MKIGKEKLKRWVKQSWIWMLRNDMFIFLIFVAIASLFWWGRTMSSPREATISLPITYTDISNQIVFTNPLPSQIDVTLRDNGKVLRQINHAAPSISISLADRLVEEEGTIVLSADILRGKIQDILPGSTSIQLIRPENITTSYIRQASKVVPIALQASWMLSDQYQLAHAPTLFPQEVEIFGSRSAIALVDTIKTESMVITNLKDTLQRILSLVSPSGLRVMPQTTTLTLIAEQFTDKSFTLPIQIEGIPEEEIIHTFPSEVTVTVRVGISNFAKVSPQDFHAVCQYPSTPVSVLPIEIVHTNPYITLLRTNIREIEYIIERK